MPRKTGERRVTLDIGGIPVPTRIITERGRRSTLASVRERALYIRLPHDLSEKEREKRVREMVDWAEKTARQKPETFRHFAPPPVAAEYTFDFRGSLYRFALKTGEDNAHTIKRTGHQTARILLSTRDTRPNLTRLLPKLLAKYFAGLYLPKITDRVIELNDLHFGQTIRGVRLSDTYSRWGSCSHGGGNINLATRLLLAPDAVIDAVIVHELAHLIEPNHGPRFWAEVARALPDYQRYDDWLKEYGNTLRFTPVPV